MREADRRRLCTVGLDDTLQLYDTLQKPKLKNRKEGAIEHRRLLVQFRLLCGVAGVASDVSVRTWRVIQRTKPRTACVTICQF